LKRSIAIYDIGFHSRAIDKGDDEIRLVSACCRGAFDFDYFRAHAAFIFIFAITALICCQLMPPYSPVLFFFRYFFA